VSTTFDLDEEVLTWVSSFLSCFSAFAYPRGLVFDAERFLCRILGQLKYRRSQLHQQRGAMANFSL